MEAPFELERHAARWESLYRVERPPGRSHARRSCAAFDQALVLAQPSRQVLGHAHIGAHGQSRRGHRSQTVEERGHVESVEGRGGAQYLVTRRLDVETRRQMRGKRPTTED